MVGVVVPSHWLVLSGLKRQGRHLVRDGFSLIFASIDEKDRLASDSKTCSEGSSARSRTNDDIVIGLEDF